jgi:peptidyl-prolyl cis-trans isomerase D
VAFEMDEGEPQLAEVIPGNMYLIYDVPEITQSATAPLAEIRDDVTERWRRNEGAKAARAAADRVIARVGKEEGLQQAMTAEEERLPPVDNVNLSRDQISQQGRVPPVLALLFSMAEGTTKKLEMPNDAGWFVLKLDDIEPGEVAEDDPIIASTVTQLGQVVGDEYADQFLAAIQRDMTVERNQVAIDAVSAQLTGLQNN